MRHIIVSQDFRDGFVEMLPACVGLFPFGVVCGVGAAAAGADWLASLGMSAIVFSGAAQIVTAQMVAGGAPFAIIVLTTFVLGLRLLMYSAAIAPYLKPLPVRWQRGLAFLLSDQVFAAGIKRFHIGDDAHAAGLHFLGSGIALWLDWQVACMIGYFAGNLIPPAWALEFAVPLCFIALVAPLFRDAPSVLAAITAGIMVLAMNHLPMKLNLIVAGVLGIVVGTLADLARERWKAR
jgi:predicted branched-subunit amino acid permease